MTKNVFRKGLVIGIIILFVGASVLPSISGNIANESIDVNSNVKDKNVRSRDILFEDNFNDNIKDYSKWSESGSGIWYEQNQRTELYLSSTGPVIGHTVTSISIPVTITTDNSVIISVDIISYISGNSNAGQTRFSISDGINSITINYYRPANQLLYADSNDGGIWTELGYRDDGTWSNQVEIYSDRYKVHMDTYDSGWIYDSLFSTTTQITIKMSSKFQANGDWQFGYDNVLVQGEGGNQPPNPPSNPSPSDGETDVDVDADLGWTGGDPDPEDTVVYNVYLEADNPDPEILVSDHQSETTFDPGTMDYGTVYYWRISAIDNHNRVTQGPVWSFTTEEAENQPPNLPTIDGPLNGIPGEEYEYTVMATDPDNDDILYDIDWDDSYSEGGGPFNSGVPMTRGHTWSEVGTYTIKAKATDIYGLESDWSELIVTMPRNRAVDTPFLQFLEQYPILYQLLQRFLQL